MLIFFAAVGMLIANSFRSSSPEAEDDDVGLFIGSARPLAATSQTTKVPNKGRSQKRAQLV
jgi:hypothetical protein